MSSRPPGPGSRTALFQTGLVLFCLAGLAVWPRAQGRFLLLPLAPGAASGMVAAAVDNGALLIARGPLPWSVVVQGDRATLAGALLRRGVLLVAAPRSGCGPAPTGKISA